MAEKAQQAGIVHLFLQHLELAQHIIGQVDHVKEKLPRMSDCRVSSARMRPGRKRQAAREGDGRTKTKTDKTQSERETETERKRERERERERNRKLQKKRERNLGQTDGHQHQLRWSK